MNTSDELYEKVKDLERNELLKIKLLSKETDAVGKTIKAIHNTLLMHIDLTRYVLIVFTDGTALLYEDSDLNDYPVLQNSYQLDGKGKAYLTDLECWLKELGYVNHDIANELLDTLVKWQEANYAQTIKEDIQCKLDEISKLKEKL